MIADSPDTSHAVVEMPAQGVILLAGLPRAGKTVTALQITLAVAAGRSIFGAPASVAGPVVFVEGSLGPEDLRRWLLGMKEALEISDGEADVRFVLPTASAEIVGGPDWAAIEAICTDAKPALVVIDPIYLSEDAAALDIEPVTEALARLQLLARTHRCLVVATLGLGAEVGNPEPIVPAGADGLLLTDRHLGDRVRVIARFGDAEPTVLWLSRDPETFVAEPVGDELVEAGRIALANLVADFSQLAGRVRPDFAPHYARRLERTLRDFATTDKSELPISASRRGALLRDTDAMGLTPVADAQALALLASALGLAHKDELIRLLWVVNRDQHQTFDGAAERWAPLAQEALGLMGVGQPMGGPA